MKFSVGYSVMGEDPGLLPELVRDYPDSIDEVYFAWPGEPSGRSPAPAGTETVLAEELEALKGLGVRLDLLVNANCYGERALSRDLLDGVSALVRRLSDETGLDAVTTASPAVARELRRGFPALDVRASVNMRLGTVKALSYVARDFTSYCVQREFNRDPERLEELQSWADDNGKRLHVLANSGCLNFCPAQTFHDNVVAHEAAVNRRSDSAGMTTLCRELYGDPGFRVSFLQGSWIRPEDIARHARIFRGSYKLATRMHDRPRLVIDAYARGRHVGSLLDLMEPGFGPAFAPFIIDNSRFPDDDWFERTLRCDKRCGRCGWCAEVLEKVLVRIPGA